MTKAKRERIVKRMADAGFVLYDAIAVYKNGEMKELKIVFDKPSGLSLNIDEYWRSVANVAIDEQCIVIPIVDSDSKGHTRILMVSEELITDSSRRIKAAVNSYQTNYWVIQGNRDALRFLSELSELADYAKKIEKPLAHCQGCPEPYLNNLDLITHYKLFKKQYVKLTETMKAATQFTLEELVDQRLHAYNYR